METSISELLDNISIQYKNILNLLEGFQLASDSGNTNSTITITQYNPDGSTYTKSIDSYQKLLQEFKRIDNNFKSLINIENIAYILNADGSLSQITKTSFNNGDYIDSTKTTISPSCIVDYNAIIDDLVYPIVKMPIIIESTMHNTVLAKSFEISDGWDNIPDNVDIVQLKYLSSVGKVIFNEIDRELPIQKTQVKYFGRFNVEKCKQTPNNSNEFTINLNKILYTSLTTIGDAIELKIGDLLVTDTGASKYQITDIDKFNKKLVIVRIAGSEILTVGINRLHFNELVTNESNVIGLPIKPEQKLILFLATENMKSITYPSQGMKIDTTDFKVIYDNVEYTIDEFFANNVTNFTEYLKAIVSESTIPYSLGITPDAPILVKENFKVIQVNNHLTTSQSVKEIDTLNTSKTDIQNQIDNREKTISLYQSELDSQTFKSSDEKAYKQNQIIKLRNEITTLKQNLLSISRSLDANAQQTGLKNLVPIYNLVGFWEIQSPIVSPLTSKQHIIKYECQVRYLAINSETVDSTTYKIKKTNGEFVNVAVSPWKNIDLASAIKVVDSNNKLSWETQILDSTDSVNINQLNVLLQDGEAIEIRIRAVSEAGWPVNPRRSPWSNILRYEFPSELKANGISATISKNNTDLMKAEFDSILSNYGILAHIAKTIREGEKTFDHIANNIATGLYTSEQKNIPLDTWIVDMTKRVSILEKNNASNDVTVSIVDFNGETFNVAHNQTLEISAGAYNESIDLLDTTKFGSIIRKRAYIKIKNNNNVPIEFKTLSGNKMDYEDSPQFYDVPVNSPTTPLQDINQIIYFRNTDLTFSSEVGKLYSIPAENKQTDLNPNYLDTNAGSIVYISNGNFALCTLKPEYADTDFIATTTDNPLYSTSDITKIKSEFDRLKQYSLTLKSEKQNAIAQNGNINVGDVNLMNNTLTGFNANDVYSIGKTTCGAFLYPLIHDFKSISVNKSTANAVFTLAPNGEILIPFIFEYRMTDRLGNINGIKLADNDLTYSKKIGVSLLVNNNRFDFDIFVSARLKSKISIKDSLAVSSVVNAYKNENTEIIQ